MSFAQGLEARVYEDDEVATLRTLSFGAARRFLGSSPAAEKLAALVPRLAVSEVALLIEGETGVGKTFVARLVHEGGGARANPSLRSAAYGTQLDTAVKTGIDANPTLRSGGVTTTPRFVFGPDVNGPAGGGVSWDATTIPGFDAHIVRYGAGVRPLLWLELRWW